MSEIMTPAQKAKCRIIIHSFSAGNGVIGAATAIPGINLASNIPITAAQVGMIVALGKVFDQKITYSAAEGMAAALAAKFVGQAASRAVASFIPIAGSAANAVIAGGFTEQLGWAVAEQFARGLVPGDGDDEL